MLSLQCLATARTRSVIDWNISKQSIRNDHRMQLWPHHEANGKSEMERYREEYAVAVVTAIWCEFFIRLLGFVVRFAVA